MGAKLNKPVWGHDIFYADRYPIQRITTFIETIFVTNQKYESEGRLTFKIHVFFFNAD
jgi:hypothetical protein